MKRNYLALFLLIVLIFSVLTINQCGNRNDTVSCFPNSVINVQLNLNLPSYQNLQNVGGWIYVNEQQCGTRGLIVVKTTSGFKVYDRNAPHICPNTSTTLSVENDIKIVCPQDQSQWILLTGEPTSIAQVPPKTYLYNYDASSHILSIYN